MEKKELIIGVVIIILVIVITLGVTYYLIENVDNWDGTTDDPEPDDTIDTDGDGFIDIYDDFPEDDTEWEDWDDDDIGDNEDIMVHKWMDSPNFYVNLTSNGPVSESMAYRIIPNMNSKQADRFYYAGGLPIGDPDSVLSPYGLYAKSTADGSKEWTSWSGAFETDSEITSNIEGMNFGSKRDPLNMDFRLLFGTDGGDLYIIEDGLYSSYVPLDDDIQSFILDGSVVGVDIYEDQNNILSSEDIFIATTDSGSLYIIDGEFNITKTISIPNAELSRPSISSDGKYVYVGTRAGKLYGFVIADGSQIGNEYDLGIDEWTTDPVATVDLVYAAGDNGVIHCLTMHDCKPNTNWESGIRPVNSDRENEAKKLTTPHIRPDGEEGYIGSESGWFYMFDDEGTIINSFNTYGKIQATPVYDIMYSRLLFITANYDCLTDDPSDDHSRVFCLDTTFTFKYSIKLDGVIYGQPVIYDDFPDGTIGHPGDGEVVIGTSSQIYSFKATN